MLVPKYSLADKLMEAKDRDSSVTVCLKEGGRGRFPWGAITGVGKKVGSEFMLWIHSLSALFYSQKSCRIWVQSLVPMSTAFFWISHIEFIVAIRCLKLLASRAKVSSSSSWEWKKWKLTHCSNIKRPSRHHQHKQEDNRTREWVWSSASCVCWDDGDTWRSSSEYGNWRIRLVCKVQIMKE